MSTRKTLSQVMNELNEEGYDTNIPMDKIKLLNPSEWEIDDFHRFEGQTNPGDNSILYAISKKDGSSKIMLINAYGTESNSDINDFIEEMDPTKKKHDDRE
ncbi:phosphoribosylpyrophosphate synthetase [Paucihalobacter sp.]|uniref:phosphoribosylpyrophosphate synthetase n=1 Tax=Paucihalobacter sp. TaxID=2850405 RepID=UPI002FE41548